jgi:hypothetical protein
LDQGGHPIEAATFIFARSLLRHATTFISLPNCLDSGEARLAGKGAIRINAVALGPQDASNPFDDTAKEGHAHLVELR